MGKSQEKYILGTSDEERSRLGFQHRVWSLETQDLWRRAGIGYGSKVLELGCGPGFATHELAQLVGPLGHVSAWDISEPYLRALRSSIDNQGIHNISTRRIDLESESFPEKNFDIVYSHFFFIFMKDPGKVAKKIFKALKPGGLYLSTDWATHGEDFRVSPRSPLFEKVNDAIDRSFDGSGSDIRIQLRMPEILSEIGFKIRELKPLVRILRPNEPAWHWPGLFRKSYLPKLIEKKLLTQKDGIDFWKEWEALSKNPNAFILTPRLMDIVAEK